MPKGALLHSHLDAMVNAAVMLRFALEEPAIHVKVPTQLTKASLSSTLPTFRGLKPSEYSDEPSLTSSSYVPGTWVHIKRARENFSSEYGGPEAFDAWVVGSLTINPREAYETHNTVAKVGTVSLLPSYFRYLFFCADLGEISKYIYVVQVSQSPTFQQ